MSNNTNQLAEQQPQKRTFSAMISTSGYQATIANTLKDPERAKRFCAAITSAVATNPALQECDPPTILSGALLGESLNLSPSPQLGQYYLVPFDCAVKDANGKTVYQRDAQGNIIKGRNGKWQAVTIKKASFVMGYKGYIQLALRTGRYKHLNVLAVKEGELRHWDPLTEEADLVLIQDEAKREQLPTVGYIAMFEYIDGFRKTIYWSREKMEAHALKYSKGYAAKKGYTFWEKEFDSMAAKTMLRQLISKWGIMSVEMQTAVVQDIKSDEDQMSGEDLLLPPPTPIPGIEAPDEDQPDSDPQQDPAAAEETELTLDDI